MPTKRTYKRTVKMWEYHANVAESKQRPVPNSWGYTPELISFIAYQYLGMPDVEVNFYRPNPMGRLVAVTAPTYIWDRALLELNNPYRKEA